MKRLLSVVFISICFVACKEERMQCWSCDFTYKGSRPDSVGDTTLCNLTRTDIEIRQGKAFGTDVNGYTTWMIANCTQK